MIEVLADRQAFRARTRECWQRNSSYWLSGPLRQVMDVGEQIVDAVIGSRTSSSCEPLKVVDMGFGNAWLYESLQRRNIDFQYVGLDFNQVFVDDAKRRFRQHTNSHFQMTDMEEPISVDYVSDAVVYAFSLFELTELAQPMRNAYRFLKPGGKLIISSIDVTYLIVAVSNTMEELRENLVRYEKLQGTKYVFQPIDLGDSTSKKLVYPSVLHSLSDYIGAAMEAGFKFSGYRETVFTSKLMPKVYFHLTMNR